MKIRRTIIIFFMVLFTGVLSGQPMGINHQIIFAEGDENQIFSNNSWTNKYECSSTITYARQYKNKVRKAYVIGGANAITPYVAD